ncbi:MAG: hypothetical protein A2939_04705 [Parcubacteria group bacterium RIFCSPLOWO2_01_FULL_48_18]|nr:MAG: hypothetical protein A2939_04705 [Parcubacteria group bacterium RIFCSPLOWO2_01_FULL_48_18]OHB23992.1 MAG: hypothetical protein A3J67_06255 [Parcubacteria group bacterium RIFCSPHIGHO2_02_FULL_48_10b]
MNPFYIILIVVGALIAWGVYAYNGFVRLRYRVKEAWSDIEVQLKRRYDLIPNLVEAVKGYMTHERQVFENVTEARSRAMGAGTRHDKAQAENMLSNTLKTLFAVSENYPDLKANANFLDLQREVADTENKIQASRRFYNGTVRDYNTMVDTVPSKFIADAFKFKEEEFFDLDEAPQEREAVKVKF